MSDTFSPHTAENPFIHRVPVIPDAATDRERELAERYTRISWLIVEGDEPDSVIDGATIVWLEVEQQHFRVSPEYYDTPEEAGCMCWMLAKALAKIIDAETNI